jgi:flagella basal body P-ring formation protein FlgA
MKVEVLEDGVPGQVIRIRNPQTRRELRGKVQNEQTVVVSL